MILSQIIFTCHYYRQNGPTLFTFASEDLSEKTIKLMAKVTMTTSMVTEEKEPGKCFAVMFVIHKLKTQTGSFSINFPKKKNLFITYTRESVRWWRAMEFAGYILFTAKEPYIHTDNIKRRAFHKLVRKKV